MFLVATQTSHRERHSVCCVPGSRQHVVLTCLHQVALPAHVHPRADKSSHQEKTYQIRGTYPYFLTIVQSVQLPLGPGGARNTQYYSSRSVTRVCVSCEVNYLGLIVQSVRLAARSEGARNPRWLKITPLKTMRNTTNRPELLWHWH